MARDTPSSGEGSWWDRSKMERRNASMHLLNVYQQGTLQDELALLVLLRILVRPILRHTFC